MAAVALLAFVTLSPPLRAALAALEPALAPSPFLGALVLAALRWMRRGRALELRLARFLAGWHNEDIIGLGLFCGDLGDQLVARHADGARQAELVANAIVQPAR